MFGWLDLWLSVFEVRWVTPLERNDWCDSRLKYYQYRVCEKLRDWVARFVATRIYKDDDPGAEERWRWSVDRDGCVDVMSLCLVTFVDSPIEARVIKRRYWRYFRVEVSCMMTRGNGLGESSASNGWLWLWLWRCGWWMTADESGVRLSFETTSSFLIEPLMMYV